MTGFLVVAALLGQVRIQDEGVNKGLANRINCSGVGVTCSVTAGTAELNVTGTGTASDISCSGCVEDAALAQSYAAPGVCVSGAFVTEVRDGLPPICAVPPDTDTKGSYTAGGYVQLDYNTGEPFARFTARNSALAWMLHFTIAGQNPINATTARIELVQESTGTVKCDVVVACNGSNGVNVEAKCENDGVFQYLLAGEAYFFRWAEGACDGRPPGGNATLVVDEDETP